jgi:alkylation response protein AidB-like acyl-CoA dehydrogenase
MAKLGAEAANLHATEVGHQVLGGIGFTLGVDMQLYFRRARQSRLAWGDRDELLETVGTAILDGEC